MARVANGMLFIGQKLINDLFVRVRRVVGQKRFLLRRRGV
jgi:hypothetical protein